MAIQQLAGIALLLPQVLASKMKRAIAQVIFVRIYPPARSPVQET